VDEYTVNFYTKEPFPAMLNSALPQLYVIPPKYWKEIGGAEKYTFKPIGTGPYVLTEWKKDDRIVMDKNEKYWGKLPRGIDRIIWKPVPDDTARAAGLETGEFDLIANMSINSVPRAEAQPKLKLISVPSYRVYTVNLSNIDPTPIANKKVRQALNYAVDNEMIVKNLFMGKAKVLQGQLLFEGEFGFNPNLKPYPYDPAKARKLLAEAGYPNGFEATFKFPAGRYAQDKEVSEAVAGMLEKVGIKCKMVQLEGGEFLKQLIARELRPMYYGGSAPPPDPHGMMSQYRSDWRYAIHKNAEIDKLIDEGMVEMDLKKREKIYHKLTEIMYDECPAIFMFQGVDFYGMTKRLKNWMPTGDQRIFLYDISLED
jgi:peptide/nickel transport system substrate-binding protein